MALRVLLADESSTIKRVMQLALQDFGVEVKAVPIGLDVLQVARSFQPDVIFADVLLSKKSGYEVSTEVKSDPQLKRTPVILMWSGFMELDEAKAKACGADRRLEKPFDADHLRSVVKDLVPRLNENQISDYLTFPDLPDIVETPEEEALPPEPPAPPPARRASAESPAPTPAPAAPAKPPPAPLRANPATAPAAPQAPKARPQAPAPADPPESAPDSAFAGFVQNPDLEDPDDFQQVPLPGSKTKNLFERREDEEWRQGGLEQFRVAPGLPELEAPDGLIDVSEANVALMDSSEDMPLDELEDLAAGTASSPQVPLRPATAPSRTFTRTETPATASVPALDPVRAEEVLREQVREVLESIAWKIIPDIAERVVREEIQKLLKESERLS